MTLRFALDLKQHWAAREAGLVLPQSQYLALFAGGEVRVQPARWLAATAGLALPLFCVSPGQNSQGRVYRLGLGLAT